MSSAADNQSPGSQPLQVVPVLQWLLMSVVAVAVVALVAAHCPQRVKLLGAFAVGYGLLSGWMIGQLAQMSRLPFSRALVVAAAALILGGEIGLAVESWRLQSAELRRLEQTNQSTGSAAFIPLLDEKRNPDDPQAKAALDESRTLIQEELTRRQRMLAEETRFTGYLRRRVSSLGSWTAPWPAVFWGAEVAAGVVAGTWLFGRVGRRLLNSGRAGQ